MKKLRHGMLNHLFRVHILGQVITVQCKYYRVLWICRRENWRRQGKLHERDDFDAGFEE